MAISTADYLKGFYDSTRAMGEKVISSDFTFEIEGFEGTYLLAKQCPWPELSTTGEIEISTPMGATMFQPQQVKVAQQGQVSFYETVAGDIQDTMVQILANGGLFNAWIYEGTPDRYIRRKHIVDCFIQMDNLVFQDACKAVERLAEGHRHRVLQLCASHLHYACEVIAALPQLGYQVFQVREQGKVARIQPHMDGCRVGVVGGLGAVHMVVRGAVFVLSGPVSHVHESNVGYDLVGVHVGTGPGPSLDHVHGEFLVVFPCQNILAGRLYPFILAVCEQAERMVRLCCGHLGVGQSVDESRVELEPEPAYGEVLHATQGLYPVKCFGRQLPLSEKVVLYTCFSVISHFIPILMIFNSVKETASGF